MTIDTSLCSECIDHLEQALEAEEPSEKDFHIRHALQACGVAQRPDEE